MSTNYNLDEWEIIDAHIHPFMSRETNVARIWFGGDSLVTPEKFVEIMKDNGVDKACGSFLLWDKHCTWEDIEFTNKEMLALWEKFPDFYIPGMQIHGWYPERSCAEMETMFRKGVRWIGELVPYLMHNGEYSDPGMMQIYDLAQQLGMVVSIHDGSPLEQINDITKKFPNLKVVLAHPGNQRERVEFLATHKNVYLDISGALFRWNWLRWACDTCGSEKLLMGSDFPICPPGCYAAMVLHEDLTAAEKRNILSGNYKRITSV